MRNTMENKRLTLIAGLIAGLALLGAAGYRFWYQPSFDFFVTDDASVRGSLVQVAAPAAGRVDDLFFDVGNTVDDGTVLAAVKVVAAPAGAATAAPSVPRLLARVASPVAGTIATRDVSVGDTVAAGQSLATVVDLRQLWVVVNVDEDRAADIQLGQSADVAIGDVHRTFRGAVVDTGSATTVATSNAAPVTNDTSDTKKVPVKIAFDYAGARLVPGMSATVTIYLR
jgi:multidrug resistance efflux pump